ncbi:MAG: hypothetical protein WCY00_02925 [Candidatus Dojkabacteria bacterium]|jgi:hypothetical protein
MNKSILKNKYSGQALAIAMLVLVISSLLGLAMYSRTRKDKAITLEERASAEALQVSDVILNSLTTFTIEEVIEAINKTYHVGDLNGFDEEKGVVLIENSEKSEITELFQTLELFNSPTTTSSFLSPLCPIDIKPNEYQLTLKRVDKDTVYEVRPGHVWSFPTRKLVVYDEDTDCKLNVYVSEIGDSFAGFVETRLYCEYDVEDRPISCIDYDEYDNQGKYKMKKYMFFDARDDHPSFYEEDKHNWIEMEPSKVNPAVTVDLGGNMNPPSELRIKALGRTGSPGIGVSYRLDGKCPEIVNMYEMRVTANCSGVYRGKEMVIPHRAYSALFDYVYFSGM